MESLTIYSSVFHVDIGDTVAVDEVVCEIETDKVSK